MTKRTQKSTIKNAAKKKVTSKKAPKRKAAAAEPGRTVSEGQTPQSCTPEERYGMVAETAYRIAEQRGFQEDKMLDDWLQAEAEVDARISSDR